MKHESNFTMTYAQASSLHHRLGFALDMGKGDQPDIVFSISDDHRLCYCVRPADDDTDNEDE